MISQPKLRNWAVTVQEREKSMWSSDVSYGLEASPYEMSPSFPSINCQTKLFQSSTTEPLEYYKKLLLKILN